MASTGEVASFGKDIHEAYWASLLSTTGFKFPALVQVFSLVVISTKPEMVFYFEAADRARIQALLLISRRRGLPQRNSICHG
jgi:hypothetical protein